MPDGDRPDPGGPGELAGLRVGGAEHGDQPEEQEHAHLAEPAVPVGPAAAGVAPGREDRDGADGEQPPLAGERAPAQAEHGGDAERGERRALDRPRARGARRGEAQGPDAVDVRAADPVGVVVGVVDAHLQRERDAERQRGPAQVERAQLGGGAAADEDRGGGGGQRARTSALHPVAGSGHVSFLSVSGARSSRAPASRAAARRSILPGPRSGSEPVTTRWRGAWAAPRRSVTAARASASVGAVPGAGHDDGDDDLPPLRRREARRRRPRRAARAPPRRRAGTPWCRR